MGPNLSTKMCALVVLLFSSLLPSSNAQAGDDVDALAARGQILVNADPIALDLRGREEGEAGRRGFEIGMAAAEGQTLPGPGKQRIHDSLPAGQQNGFSSAVSYSLGRNRSRGGGVSPDAVVVATGNGRGPVADPKLVDQVQEQLRKPPFIGNVEVTPGWMLNISFTSTQKSTPVVEISQLAPIRDRYDVLVFPRNSGAVSGQVSMSGARHYSDFDVLHQQLQPNKNYYFIITVPNDSPNGGSRQRDQETGRFTMASAGNPSYLCFENSVRGVDGSAHGCRPYLCEAGRCTNSCNSVDDCDPPFLCDLHRECTSNLN